MRCDVCRRDRTQVDEFYEMIYQQVVSLPRCTREKLKRVPSAELGTRVLSSLSFNLPDLHLQLSTDSVPELGDVVLAAVFSCDSTSDLVPGAGVLSASGEGAGVGQLASDSSCRTSASGTKSEVESQLNTAAKTTSPNSETESLLNCICKSGEVKDKADNMRLPNS